MPNIGEDPEARARASVFQRNSANIFLRASAEEEERGRRVRGGFEGAFGGFRGARE